MGIILKKNFSSNWRFTNKADIETQSINQMNFSVNAVIYFLAKKWLIRKKKQQKNSYTIKNWTGLLKIVKKKKNLRCHF